MIHCHETGVFSIDGTSSYHREVETLREAEPALQPNGERKNVDPARFDALLMRLATVPLPRSKVLHGLVSGTALCAIGLLPEPGVAKKRKNKDEPKRKLCHCQDATAATCRTITKATSQVKKHLKKHPCDYKGGCTGVSGCPCQGENATCTAHAQCCPGLFCGDGTCRPTGSCTLQGEACRVTSFGVPVGLPCCTGVCNAGGAGPTRNTCAPCGTEFAACKPFQDPSTCCPPRFCLFNMEASTIGGGVCCSILGESCFMTQGGPNGFCCNGTCPQSGPSARRCCMAAGNPAPGGCPAGGSHALCCNLTCNAATGLCT
jgi:hypothetical protein